jgi:hypothetical protein
MRTLESNIQDFANELEGGATHRRPFLNLRDSIRQIKWYDCKYHI